MTLARRFFNILLGLLTIVCALLIFFAPEIGIYIALAVFSVVFLVYSIRMIVYYIRLARHMVGGQIVVFLGIFAFCCALYALNINNAPRKTITVILVIILIFTGIVDLLRAREAKNGGAGSWKFSMASAVIGIILAVTCLIFSSGNPDVTGIIFGITLCYSGVSRIIASLRKANWNKIMKNAIS